MWIAPKICPNFGLRGRLLTTGPRSAESTSGWDLGRWIKIQRLGSCPEMTEKGIGGLGEIG